MKRIKRRSRAYREARLAKRRRLQEWAIESYHKMTPANKRAVKKGKGHFSCGSMIRWLFRYHPERMKKPRTKPA